MTSGSLTVSSCLAQAGQLRFEHPPNLLVRHAAPSQALDRGSDLGLSGAQPAGRLPRARARRDERAGTLPQLDDAFVLELAICLGHRVRIDHELLREGTNAGQLLARTQRTRLDAVLHLLHQLEVDGNAGRRVRSEHHRELYY